jgi:N utilization substance protein B
MTSGHGHERVDLTKELADGVEKGRTDIDALIASHSKGWTLERMPAIDRTILRIATYELVSRADTPVAVIIDEAVELAKRFSTDDSGRFVNGVLAAVARSVR